MRKGVVHSGIDEDNEIVGPKLPVTGQNPPVQRSQNETHQDATNALAHQRKSLDIHLFFKMAKIDKQLKDLPQDLKTALENEMFDHLAKRSTQAKIELNQRQLNVLEAKLSEKKELGVFDPMEVFMSVWGTIQLRLFDIYVLARVVRHSWRVIIYAGAAHTQRIREFLVAYLGYHVTLERRSKIRGKNFQCLDITGPPRLFT